MFGIMRNENLWAPAHRDEVANTAFSAYAFRQQQIEDVINMLVATDDPNDFSTQCFVYNAVGINSDIFTDSEINYIEREVSRKRV